jgi:1-deoxy-D-xylulose-5-phosphate reductoisomerase
MKAAAEVDGADTVVTSVVGIAGLIPTVHAIRKGRNIALANKETLVTAGEIVMSEAERSGRHHFFPWTASIQPSISAWRATGERMRKGLYSLRQAGPSEAKKYDE